MDNAKATVRVEWATPASDWDMKVFRDANGDGSSVGETQVVGTSAQGTTDFEQVTIGEAQLTPGGTSSASSTSRPPSRTTGPSTSKDPSRRRPPARRAGPRLRVTGGHAQDVQAITVARGGRRLLNLDDACASPVLGKTTVGANVNVMTIETKRANRFGLSSAVRATRLRAYLDGRGRTTGSQNVRGVVYADAAASPARC